VPKPAVIFSLKTLLICPNLHASFGVCDFGQQISANLQGKFAAANYESLIPATLFEDFSYHFPARCKTLDTSPKFLDSKQPFEEGNSWKRVRMMQAL